MIRQLTPVVGSSIELWDDSKIRPGAVFAEEARGALQTACAVVILVSPGYLALKWNELLRVLERARLDGLKILWIPVRPTLYQRTPVAQFQPLSSPDKSLFEMAANKRERTIVEICHKILEIVAVDNPTPPDDHPPSTRRRRSGPSWWAGNAARSHASRIRRRRSKKWTTTSSMILLTRSIVLSDGEAWRLIGPGCHCPDSVG